MSLSSLLAIPELEARYKKVKKYFYLREAAYDVTSVCQLRCDGCYYFEGDKYKVIDNRDPLAWRQLLQSERDRGITYVNLAGAEPSMMPEILRACYETIPLGTVFTNGLKRIEREIGYRLHLSVWGDGSGDPIYRKQAGGRDGPYCLPIQLKNYLDDDRVVFVYTFNSKNIDQADEVLRQVASYGHKITFNVFSAPEGNRSQLKLGDQLAQIRDKMMAAMDRYPETVIYSEYNAEVHTGAMGLRDRFSCPYPRAARDSAKPFGIGKTFRNYRADLSYDASSCCVPDTDCADCRHYAAGSAIISSRLDLHIGSEQDFRRWLDYVDTYLAVWMPGYKKGENLYRAVR
jgi:MoaA/NifB/PqqE/SkfB family radical SAM enzyme